MRVGVQDEAPYLEDAIVPQRDHLGFADVDGKIGALPKDLEDLHEDGKVSKKPKRNHANVIGKCTENCSRHW